MSADRDNPDEVTADRERGLEHRYDVKRVKDPDGKHDTCRYFVLDPQHDVLARGALLSYANACMDNGYDALAKDLVMWVGEIEARERHGALAEELDRIDRLDEP